MSTNADKAMNEMW